ncbi:hypothetical protein Pyn_37710 [Prunus yedoensis var. nudiflora]|uniref:Uncharacterized protein n=1 Tax=Prunus yedoensis var. nudiflora TaxID=2094558 RepID=A0A314ZFM6_PRUYE|nr:hypothetical protein Pyn_37710 [Prunus yedoensis var. nudiflora]
MDLVQNFPNIKDHIFPITLHHPEKEKQNAKESLDNGFRNKLGFSCGTNRYNLNSNEVTRKLEGHAKRATSLAFSNTLNVLVSSGADAYWKPQLLSDMASTLM